jgi:prevent-host-death family protein
MQGVRSNNHQGPALRTVGLRELRARAGEIVREVRETGQPVDITVRGEVVARLTPPSIPESDVASARAHKDQRTAVDDWLLKMDEVSKQVGMAWPADVSAQDVIDDVRGSW